MTAEGRANKPQRGSPQKAATKTSKNHAGEIFSDSEWGLRSDRSRNEHVSAIAPQKKGGMAVSTV